MRSIKITIIFACTFCILLASNAFATTYYVRKDGNNSCDGTVDVASTGAPWHCAELTIQAGINDATTAGDIVYVHQGTYSESPSSAHAGSSGSPITISAYPGEEQDAIITGEVDINHSYITLNGFDIQVSGRYFVQFAIYLQSGGDHARITNNRFWPTQGSCPNSGSYAIWIDSTDNYYYGNLFEGDGTDAHGWFIPFNINATRQTFENNIIRNILDCERIWDGPSAGITVDDVVIRGNEVYGLYSDRGDNCCAAHVDMVQIIERAGTWYARDWLIENNYIHDCEMQGFGMNEFTPSSRQTGWVFRGNVMANITEMNQMYPGGSAMYNNTFFQCGTVFSETICGEAIQQNGCATPVNGAGDIFKNNLVINWQNSSSVEPLCLRDAGATVDHNYIGRQRSGGYGTFDSGVWSTWGEPNSINGGDPKFVAAYDDCINNTCNFHLQATSPLIGAGVAITGYTTDKDGVAWGSPPSIGAYEYGAGTGSTSSPRGATIGSGNKTMRSGSGNKTMRLQ